MRQGREQDISVNSLSLDFLCGPGYNDLDIYKFV